MQEQIEFRRDDLSGDQALKLIERLCGACMPHLLGFAQKRPDGMANLDLPSRRPCWANAALLARRA